jgi:predicted RNA binding protein with dsRBD fold (UPF0201 family)
MSEISVPTRVARLEQAAKVREALRQLFTAGRVTEETTRLLIETDAATVRFAVDLALESAARTPSPPLAS